MRQLPTSLLLVLTLAIGPALACRAVGPHIWVDELPANEISTDEYRIAPGDTLGVWVLNQEHLSRKVRVREDGKVTLPMVDDVEAAGKTPPELQEALANRLAQFITTPEVSVAVDESKPFEISVLGEVRRPGTFIVPHGSGVLHAIASGGGLTDYAHEDRIFVVRADPAPKRIRFDYEKLTRAGEKAAAFRLRRGDVVVVE